MPSGEIAGFHQCFSLRNIGLRSESIIVFLSDIFSDSRKVILLDNLLSNDPYTTFASIAEAGVVSAWLNCTFQDAAITTILLSSPDAVCIGFFGLKDVF